MFRWLRRREKWDQDLDEEIRFHLSEETRLRVDAGEPPTQAGASARRAFGSTALVKEVTRTMWGWAMLERVLQDLRVARRALARSPGYLAVVVSTLALGIGATTALFTVVNAVLLRPLPFTEPDRLVMVWERPPFAQISEAVGVKNVVQTQNYLDWRARNRSFEAIAALQPLPMNISGSGEPIQVNGLMVTGEFFSVLGVPPMLGRGIVRGEDTPDGARTAVLTFGFWRQHFGGDSSVVGGTVAVNGVPHEIVGVMPPGFAFPGAKAELFVPLRIDPATAPRNGRNLRTVARLRTAASIAAAHAEIEAIAAQIGRERPTNEGWSATVVSLREEAVGDVRLPLVILFAAVVFVLIIACVNVMNLGLMRGAVRAHEMTIRVALGAGRGRLLHQLVVENLLVAALGGFLGLVLAHQGVTAILAMFPANLQFPRAQEIAVDGRVLVFTMLMTLGMGLLFGIAPSLQAARRDLVETLHSASRTIAAATSRFRSSLVVIEVALAVVVVIGAGLMGRSLLRLYNVNPGFRPDHVLTVRTLMQRSASGRPGVALSEILDGIRSIPGVTDAGSIHGLPLSGFGSGTGWSRADRPAPRPSESPVTEVSVITPGYFRTMGIRLVAGRDFDRRDTIDAPHVVIINQTLSAQNFAGENPVGKRIRMFWGRTPEFEIVGVVADNRTGGRSGALKQGAGPVVFLANPQEPNQFAAIVVRTTGDPLAVASAVRQKIRAVNPVQGVAEIETMEQIVSDSVADQRLQTTLLAAFGTLALLLSAVGLYGVISYSVEQRRREMGIRLALGAGRHAVLRLVLRQGLSLTAVGLTAGLGAAFALTRYLDTLLYQVQPTDPAVFTSVAAILMTTAAFACYLPARRATRVDPATVLRDE